MTAKTRIHTVQSERSEVQCGFMTIKPVLLWQK